MKEYMFSINDLVLIFEGEEKQLSGVGCNLYEIGEIVERYKCHSDNCFYCKKLKNNNFYYIRIGNSAIEIHESNLIKIN